MKTGTVLALGIGAFLLWNFAGLARAAQVLAVQFTGVQFVDFLHYKFNFVLQNVSNTPITVNSLVGQVTVNGTDLGSVSYFGGTIEVPANGQAPLAVNFAIDVLSLPASMQNILQHSQNLQFEVTGNVNANGLVIPFDVTQTAAI